MVDKGAPKNVIEQNIAGFNKSLTDDKKIGEIGATQAVEAVWKKFSAKNKEYTKYKIKIAVTIIGAAAESDHQHRADGGNAVHGRSQRGHLHRGHVEVGLYDRQGDRFGRHGDRKVSGDPE